MHLERLAVIVREHDDAIRCFVDALVFELVEDSPAMTDDGRPKRWVVVRPAAQEPLLLARADGVAERSGRIGTSCR